MAEADFINGAVVPGGDAGGRIGSGGATVNLNGSLVAEITGSIGFNADPTRKKTATKVRSSQEIR